MKKLFLIFLFLLIACPAWGATYFVSQTGAGGKTGADVDNASEIATFNAGTAPYNVLDDDTVYLLDTLTTAVTIPDGGTAGHVATIRGDYAGHPCIIANSTTAQNNLYISGKPYVSIYGFSIKPTTTTSPQRGIYLNGTVDNITVSDIAIDLSGSSAATKTGIHTAGAATNILLQEIAIVGAGTNVLLHGVGSGNITLANIVSSGGAGFDIDNVHNLTMNNCSQSASTSYGFYLHDSVTGLFVGNNLTATGNTNIDYFFTSLTLDSGSKLINSTTSNSTYTKVNNTSNLEISNFVSDGAYSLNPAVFISNGSYNILLNSCEVKNGGNDAYYIYDAVGVSHDINFINCVAHDGGDKTNGGNGDGFTVHGNAYNVNIYYSKAYNMTGTAVAMVGNSAGNIYNFTSYNNGGDWTSEGGVETTRAGTYIATTALNPTTGTGWTIKNMISKGNYPREIYLTTTSKGLVDIDYNLYNETTSSQFATIDDGASNITWETYHATYEEYSLNTDPLFIDSANSNFHLQSESPARGAGVDVGLSNTNPPDIGAEPYKQYVPWR